MSKEKEKTIKILNRFTFNNPFEIMGPIIRNIQTIGNLMNFIESKIISDPIILKGETTFEENTWFFFRYKKFMDIYMKIDEVIESDYYLSINYNIYKTSPKFIQFHLIFHLHYINENESLFILENIFPQIDLNRLYIKLLNFEFISNCNILSKAISLNKRFTFNNNGTVFKINYDFLQKLFTHYKLFRLLFPDIKSIEKINKDDDKVNSNEEIIKEEQNFKIQLKQFNKYNLPSEIFMKISKSQILKTQSLISFSLQNYHNYINLIEENKFIFFIKKITSNKTFFLLKSIYNNPIEEKKFNDYSFYSKKLIHNIKNICLVYQNTHHLEKSL